MIYKNQLREYCIPYWQMNMINHATEFWRDMAIWSRIYLASIYTGLGDQEEVFSRLYRVPYEFGNTIRLIYGDEIANGYINLLSNQVILARDLVNAQLNGNVETVNGNTVQLYQNADTRAAYLSQINPYWDVNDWRTLMHGFISLSLEESTAFFSKGYNLAIDIFDRILRQASQIGNYFSQGLFNYLLNSKS